MTLEETQRGNSRERFLFKYANEPLPYETRGHLPTWRSAPLPPLPPQDENGEVLSPFLPAGASPVSASAQAGRERSGDSSSVSSASSAVSPVSQAPAQAAAFGGREGSLESRYQSPLEDFRVSQEPLLDHLDPQNRQTRYGRWGGV